MEQFINNVEAYRGIIAFYTLALFGFVKLNIWYWGERKKMTPEERRQQDEEDNSPYE